MRNFGLMLIKNEAPILREVMAANTRYIKNIFVLDGGNDNSEAILREFPEVTYYVHERELFARHGWFKINDGVRHYLFEEILKTAELGDWVTIMHGDEIFYHDPNETIVAFSFADVNTICWYSPHFFPHTDDLKDWDVRSTLPLQERFRHYAHYGDSCYLEFRQFKIEKGMHYDATHHARVIPEGVQLRSFKAHPILQHYKIWNLNIDDYIYKPNDEYFKHDVIMPRGKWSKIVFTPKKFEEFFIDSYPGFAHTGVFDGSFGPLENSYNTMRDNVRRQLAGKGVSLDELKKIMVPDA